MPKHGTWMERALLGQSLRWWRLTRQATSKEMAALMGVSCATWSRWESGERFPNQENLGTLWAQDLIDGGQLLSHYRQACLYERAYRRRGGRRRNEEETPF